MATLTRGQEGEIETHHVTTAIFQANCHGGQNTFGSSDHSPEMSMFAVYSRKMAVVYVKHDACNTVDDSNNGQYSEDPE